MSQTDNPYVLITGASSGIGYALAKKFASEKYNLILVARNETSLLELSLQCQKQYGVQSYIVSSDLIKYESCLQHIAELIKNENIVVEILVNNAGFGVRGQFVNTDLLKEVDMIDLQLGATISLTKLVLKDMIKRRAGYILNVGSIYSLLPVPFQSVYGACKSFLYSFSVSLAHEVKNHGIGVTIVCPGLVLTEFQKRSGMTSSHKKHIYALEPEQVAAIAYQALLRKKLVVVPGLINRFVVFIASKLTTAWSLALVAKINGMRGANATVIKN